jgi:hypothetical protein
MDTWGITILTGTRKNTGATPTNKWGGLRDRAEG